MASLPCLDKIKSTTVDIGTKQYRKNAYQTSVPSGKSVVTEAICFSFARSARYACFDFGNLVVGDPLVGALSDGLAGPPDSGIDNFSVIPELEASTEVSGSAATFAVGG
jgi:hypothetical protein